MVTPQLNQYPTHGAEGGRIVFFSMVRDERRFARHEETANEGAASSHGVTPVRGRILMERFPHRGNSTKPAGSGYWIAFSTDQILCSAATKPPPTSVSLV